MPRCRAPRGAGLQAIDQDRARRAGHLHREGLHKILGLAAQCGVAHHLGAGALQVLEHLVQQDQGGLIAQHLGDAVAAGRDAVGVVVGHSVVAAKLGRHRAPHRMHLLALHKPALHVELLAVEHGDAHGPRPRQRRAFGQQVERPRSLAAW